MAKVKNEIDKDNEVLKESQTKKVIMTNGEGKFVKINERVDNEHEDGKTRKEERIKEEEVKKIK